MPDPAIVFFDIETTLDQKLTDIGAVDAEGGVFHAADYTRFRAFLAKADILAGHNIVNFDLKVIEKALTDELINLPVIDTLYASALLFPQKQFHKLLKDEKLVTTDVNNPVTDAKKARDLFAQEVTAYRNLDPRFRRILCDLLANERPFRGFFLALGEKTSSEERATNKSFLSRLKSSLMTEPTLAERIRDYFTGRLCDKADIENLIAASPVELGFALGLIEEGNAKSAIPGWITHAHPAIDRVMHLLRGTPCGDCPFCTAFMDAHAGLNKWFGFDQFRTYADEPLQQSAAEAAIDGQSVLAIFPTGGGKSLTFQLPALMAGEATRGLTVVISPLQSLMKDQVDHLVDRGIDAAVTINGALSPLERAEAIERVKSGDAKLLYISPEQLRSRTIAHLLEGRRIERFVIDEAHCFSAWGHDFRVDYLYIGAFISKLTLAQNLARPIPVSCFTATAKQKVIQDICDYFRELLKLDLRLFATSAERTNLRYRVIHTEDREDKYRRLRELVMSHDAPAIVYTSRTATTEEIAARLSTEGFPALPYHGQMEPEERKRNQERFLADDVRIMVATNAFGMGVDKSNVGMVVHYEISSSLENYVQEAGRAGRDDSIQADCFILFNEEDLESQFTLLQSSVLSLAEIQKVWRGIKLLTKKSMRICVSEGELARAAGLETDGLDVVTRIRAAVSQLEIAGYVRREENYPLVYGTSLTIENADEGVKKILASDLWTDDLSRSKAQSLLSHLVSAHHTHKADEARIDTIASYTGLPVKEIVGNVMKFRSLGILRDENDLTAQIAGDTTEKKSKAVLENALALEEFFMKDFALRPGETPENAQWRAFNLKELNGRAQSAGLDSSIESIKNILTGLRQAKMIEDDGRKAVKNRRIRPLATPGAIRDAIEKNRNLGGFVLNTLYRNTAKESALGDEVYFSLHSLWKDYGYDLSRREDATLKDVADTLLYLKRIRAINLSGGFMVLHNRLTIERLVTNNFRQYKKEDYAQLDNYYAQKFQQIHIVGEYANLMLRDKDKAREYVRNYFEQNYQDFVQKWFKGERRREIKEHISPTRFKKIFGDLSEKQLAVIDDRSQFIQVAAGPGSGKTRVLVHKLASLLVREDVRPEELLMLTFSRAAATEFKTRLVELIGGEGYFVDIKTFHSYAFDILGLLGTLDTSEDVVARATEAIKAGRVDRDRIAKTVLVIDEAQDMDAREFALVETLIEENDTMRVIAVGDDDQNIYAFRGSDSQYFRSLATKYDAMRFELLDNYRSTREIVAFSNLFGETLKRRLKTNPARAVRKDMGSVTITRHAKTDLTTPVVEEILASDRLRTPNAQPDGKKPDTIAVLTVTNEKAFEVYGALLDKKIDVKLIQGRDSAAVKDWLEMRFFTAHLAKKLVGKPVISEEDWTESLGYLKAQCADSVLLPDVLKLLKTFWTSSGRVRYRTDLEEFIRESQPEDALELHRSTVVVSTIHKAKGREFDRVILLLERDITREESDKRTLYVGMTRAKTHLSIHAVPGAFPFDLGEGIPGLVRKENPVTYPALDRLTFNLDHHDVWLGFFKDPARKRVAMTLRAGSPLSIMDEDRALGVRTGDGRTVKLVVLSKKRQAEIAAWREKGYGVESANVYRIVAWRDKNDPSEAGEYAVILPTLFLRRHPIETT